MITEWQWTWRTRVGVPVIFILLWPGLGREEILVGDFFELDHDDKLDV
jgi:hypothetical protein